LGLSDEPGKSRLRGGSPPARRDLSNRFPSP
jgi:hypothetical protein